jgi:hypothetical protein
METDRPEGFVITITGDERGVITAHDSRTGKTDEWTGLILVLGDVGKNAFAHFSWGHYQSIVYGMYAAIMDAKYDKTEVGGHHRNILGRICRMIVELYGFFQRAKNMTPEEALEKWEKEDAEKEGKVDKDTIFH